MPRSHLRLAAAILTLVAILAGTFAIPVAQAATLWDLPNPWNNQPTTQHGLKVTYYRRQGRDQVGMMNMFANLPWVPLTAASPGNGEAFKDFAWTAPAHFNYDTAAGAGYAKDYSWADLNPDYVEITGYVDMRGAWDVIVFSMERTRMALWVNGQQVKDNWDGNETGFVYFKYARDLPPVIHIRLCMAKPTADVQVNGAWPVNVRFDTDGTTPVDRLTPKYPIDAFNTFVHIDDVKDFITVDAPPAGVDLSKYEFSLAGGAYQTLVQGSLYVGLKAGQLVVREKENPSSSTVIGSFTVPAPRDVAVKQRTSVTTTLTWTAPASEKAPKAFEIYRNLVGYDESFGRSGIIMISSSPQGTYVGSTTALTYTDRGLEVGNIYEYSVRAVYEESYVDAEPVRADSVPVTGIPEAPKLVWVEANGGGKIRLRWDTVSGAKKYLIRREYHSVPGMYVMLIGQELVGEHWQSSYTDDTMIQGSTCSYFVQTVNANGEVSRISPPVKVYIPDATPPSVPGNFRVGEGSTVLLGPSGQVSMSWKSSTDNIGVVGYDILRKVRGKDGTLPDEQSIWEEPIHVVGSTTGNTYTDSGLVSGGYYTYYVAAKDATGNTATTEGVNITTGCAYLRAIAFMTGGHVVALEPEFQYTQGEYALAVSNGTKVLMLNPARVDPKSTVKVNGKEVADGDLVWPLNLGIGENKVEIEVLGRPTWFGWGQDTMTYTATVTRANLAELPVLTLPEGESAILEGGTYEASGSITSVATSPWIGIVDYGDGSEPEALVVNADGVFALRHVYRDSGACEVRVKFTYTDLGLVTGAATVVVGNVAPEIEFDDGTEYAVDEGSALKLTGKVVDPGADTWTMTADYGDSDSEGSEPVVVEADGTFAVDRVFYDAEPVYTATLEVADDDGAISTGEFTVNVKNVAPSVEAKLLTVAQRDVPFTGSGVFVDPGKDTWQGVVDFGDGSEELALNLSGDKSFPLEHIYTQNGNYFVTVRVVDNDGGVGSGTYPVTVKDFTFSIDAGEDAQASEGTAFDRHVVVTGPVDKVSKLTVDYGDGSAVENLTIASDAAAGSGSASLRHVYADNWMYEVTVSLVDADKWVYEDCFEVNVENVAPTVKLPGGRIRSHGWVNVSGSFADPGADTWTGTIDLGDGSGPQSLTLGAGKAFTVSHSYGWEGLYTVKAYVVDDDGGEGSATCQVLVQEEPQLVSSNARLASLAFTRVYTLKQNQAGYAGTGFAADCFSYYTDSGAITVVERIELTPANAGATIEYKDGNDVAWRPLPYDPVEEEWAANMDYDIGQTIRIRVTAADGVTQRTYTIERRN